MMGSLSPRIDGPEPDRRRVLEHDPADERGVGARRSGRCRGIRRGDLPACRASAVFPRSPAEARDGAAMISWISSASGLDRRKRPAMSLERVPAGKDVPNDCNVVIEIPMRGRPDQVRGRQGNRCRVRRPLHVDGDALSVQLRLHPADAVRRRRSLRRAGALAGAADHRRRRPLPADRHAEAATTRPGGDAKILAVPIDKLSCLYRHVQSPRDLPEITTRQIAHFFEHYKDLEPGKWVRVGIWVDAEEAKQEIIESVARFERASRRRKSPARRQDRAGHGRPRSRQGLTRTAKARRPGRRARRRRRAAARGAEFPVARRARRQPSFPGAVRAAVEHRLHRREVRPALRAAAHIPALPLRAGRRADRRCSRSPRARRWPRRVARDRARRRSPAWLVHGLYLGGVFVALAGGMPAGTIAMLVGLQPLLTVVIARGWLGERVSRRGSGRAWCWGWPGVWLVVRHKVDARRTRCRAAAGGHRARRHQRRHAVPEAALRPPRPAHRRGDPVRGLRAALRAARAWFEAPGRALDRGRSCSRSAGRCWCCRSAPSACSTGCCATARRRTWRGCSTWCRR